MAANDFSNNEDTRRANGLIGFNVPDTLDQVADVLDFITEFHLRKADSEITEEIIAGMGHIITYARDALRIQMSALTNAGATNG